MTVAPVGAPTAADHRRVFVAQRANRWALKASSATDRAVRLTRLRDALLEHAGEVGEALAADLARPPDGRYSLEVGVVLADVQDAIDHVADWMAPTPVHSSPLLPAPAGPPPDMFVQYEARGVTLIFGAWNQPFMLSLQPLIAAVAAGNPAIVKPNELSPASSALIATIVGEAFDEADAAVVEGGIDLANDLLQLPFDHIFFTGSPAVGRIVAAAAARTLTSTTLELGGRSPAIVDGTTDLAVTAAAIAGGKSYNSGQVCIAPDHVWVHRDARDEFVRHYTAWLDRSFYTDGRLVDGAVARMVDRRNFDRVTGYVNDALARGATLVGTGRSDEDALVIEPVLLLDTPPDAAVLHEEVFGPVLPVLVYDTLDEVIHHLQGADEPLAMYPFTTDQAVVDRLLAETSSGGLTANAWASHAFDAALPFGGVGNSGNGQYRGIHGFRELSHARSVVAFPDAVDVVGAMARLAA